MIARQGGELVSEFQGVDGCGAVAERGLGGQKFVPELLGRASERPMGIQKGSFLLIRAERKRERFVERQPIGRPDGLLQQVFGGNWCQQLEEIVDDFFRLRGNAVFQNCFFQSCFKLIGGCSRQRGPVEGDVLPPQPKQQFVGGVWPFLLAGEFG